MSKQSDAKKSQNYTPKAEPQVCMNCFHFSSEITERTGVFGGTYSDEKDKKCSLGGFAVKKMGTCDQWIGKKTQS